MTVSIMRKMCWICGGQVRLEACVIDEQGLAVHEECYVRKLIMPKAKPMLIKGKDPILRRSA